MVSDTQSQALRSVEVQLRTKLTLVLQFIPTRTISLDAIFYLSQI